MADDKFGFEIDINSKKAQEKLKNLQKDADKTNKSLGKENTININDKSAVDSLKKIEKEVEKLSLNIEEINTKSSKLFSFAKIGGILAGLGALAWAAKKVYNVVSDTAHEVVGLSNSATGLRMSANALKAWETAFKSIGFSAQDADSALNNIEDKLIGQMMNPSIQVASAFAMLGINTREANGEMRESQDILKDLANKFKQLKPLQAAALGMQLGLPRDLIYQMRNNPEWEKVLEQQKAKPVVTTSEETTYKNFIKEEAKLSASVDELKYKGMQPLAEGVNKLLPPVNEIATTLNKLIGKGAEPLSESIRNAKLPEELLSLGGISGKLS